jgi:hypothetical protein
MLTVSTVRVSCNEAYIRVKMRGSARNLRAEDRRKESMPVWAWILIIVLIVLLLGGGFGYRRRG